MVNLRGPPGLVAIALLATLAAGCTGTPNGGEPAGPDAAAPTPAIMDFAGSRGWAVVVFDETGPTERVGCRLTDGAGAWLSLVVFEALDGELEWRSWADRQGGGVITASAPRTEQGTKLIGLLHFEGLDAPHVICGSEGALSGGNATNANLVAAGEGGALSLYRERADVPSSPPTAWNVEVEDGRISTPASQPSSGRLSLRAAHSLASPGIVVSRTSLLSEGARSGSWLAERAIDGRIDSRDGQILDTPAKPDFPVLVGTGEVDSSTSLTFSVEGTSAAGGVSFTQASLPWRPESLGLRIRTELVDSGTAGGERFAPPRLRERNG